MMAFEGDLVRLRQIVLSNTQQAALRLTNCGLDTPGCTTTIFMVIRVVGSSL